MPIATTVKQTYKMEKSSYLWHGVFSKINIPTDGTVVEVAPGYEPKIGNALALLGFRGTIFLIEPDKEAAAHLKKIYQQVLPKATVKTIVKTLGKVRPDEDIPKNIDALVASHPFDDMVIAQLINKDDFFTTEATDGELLSPAIKQIYDSIKNKDYARGVKMATLEWKDSIKRLKPKYFIDSQYPSHSLTIKGLIKRQESGYTVLNKLKSIYEKHAISLHQEQLFGFKGNPKWWIVIKNPSQV
ncbi:MAG: hypothetical protein WC797_01460 [Candidatus Paceibacterota bacterium]|jgi:hypothetical protein